MKTGVTRWGQSSSAVRIKLVKESFLELENLKTSFSLLLIIYFFFLCGLRWLLALNFFFIA